MSQTKKNIIDSIVIILTRFGVTDDSRLDDDWLSYKIDQVRAELIVAQYKQTNIIDPSWLSDLGLIVFHRVNRADDNSISCDCDISKTFIPQFISLMNKDGSLDLGIWSVISPCGKTRYNYKRESMWGYEPAEHTNSLFGSYARINTSLYVNRIVEKLRIVGVLLDPEDGYLINSAPITSGNLVLNVVYLVKFGQIIYNGIVYKAGQTFSAVVPVGGTTPITTFVGSGNVYLNSQIASYRDIDPYPASGDMIRMIELEILTKEFGIERQVVTDVRNDSKDDASETIK